MFRKPRVIQLMVGISLVMIVIAIVMKWANWQEGGLAATALLIVSIVLCLRARRLQSQHPS
jgi:hypothetical protein